MILKSFLNLVNGIEVLTLRDENEIYLMNADVCTENRMKLVRKSKEFKEVQSRQVKEVKLSSFEDKVEMDIWLDT